MNEVREIALDVPPGQRLRALVAELPSGRPVRAFRAPGRVNLMGDHTDYNEGLVLPVAIDRECVIAAAPRDDGRVRVRSLDEPGGLVDVAADGSDEPRGIEPPWGRYVAGVVRALAARGRPDRGIDAVVRSTVPPGAGLASSAAFGVACALALSQAAGVSLPRLDLARACRDAEEAATGVPCGLMDQLVCLHGLAGRAVLIDCRSLAIDPVPLPSGLKILVVHSGITRTLADSGYADRRRASEALAAELGLRALRDASPGAVASHPLGRHVVSENLRVGATAEALRRGSLPAIGRLFAESQASLRDDYRVSTPELDVLVDELTGAGAIAARMTGAGFGGCVVSLVSTEEVDPVVARALRGYADRTGIRATPIPCDSADGAGELRIS